MFVHKTWLVQTQVQKVTFMSSVLSLMHSAATRGKEQNITQTDMKETWTINQAGELGQIPRVLSSFHWHFWGVTKGELLGSYYVSSENHFGQIFPLFSTSPQFKTETISKRTQHEFISQSPFWRRFPEVQLILKHKYITTDIIAGFYPSKNKT